MRQPERIMSWTCGILVMLITLRAISCDAASVWKVEGGKVPVYLAGSVHFLRKGDQIPQIYETVYQQSQVVAFEVEPHRFEQAGMSLLYLKEGRCVAGKMISDYLSDEVNLLLEQYLQHVGQKQSPVRRMKPWMAAMHLTVKELTRLGADPERGVDQLFYRQAMRDRKTTASLESPRSQVTLLSSLTPQEQNIFLKYTLLSLHETEVMFEELLGAWQRGDQVFLTNWFAQAAPEESLIMDKILLKRNQQWISSIEVYLQGEQPVMVIVGVGHLVGKGSVVDLLKKRGYTIFHLNQIQDINSRN